MDLSDLHIFRTVVSAGGVTRAAEKLYRVQSNVTTRVRQLEDDLGVELFIREGKRMHISPAGQILLGYANRLLDLAAEARDAVQDATPRGLLRLGAMESTAAVRLPASLNLYHERYPEVTIELKTGNPQSLASAILDDEIDAAIAAEPVADAPFEKIPVYEEELVLIARADQPPIRSPRDAPGGSILAFEHGCPWRKRLEDWFAHEGEMPERIIELGSYHAMLGCAVAGMGLALMPERVLDGFPSCDQLSVHKLPPEQDRAQVSLFWRKGARSPKIDALIEVLSGQKRADAAAP